ncbi:MAG: PHP domain-containing protein [Eubacteriales bacterium]|nr:PHP domain-containing protein [Eubacteriales bacterium]
MKAIDLHVHSTFSDGTDTPSLLVKKALTAGLSAIALTDHDTADGVAEAVAEGTKLGLEVIPGVELSTFFDHKEIHIVGLYIDYMNKEFKKELSELREVRNNRNKIMCQKFQDIGIPVVYEELMSAYPGAVLTRAHFADYLLSKGFTKSRNEAFERYIGANGPCYVHRKRLDPAKAIEMIKSAGGIAVLAHPVLYHLGNDATAKLMDYLKAAGITALEALYSTYTLGEELQMRKLASHYGLLISGGSDYHGDNKPNIHLGKGLGRLHVPYKVLEQLKNALN